MEVNLTDWLGENSWAIWLSLAFLLGIAEIMSLDLVLIMLAVGALAGAAVALFAPGYRSSADKMVGSSGVAVSQIDKSGGEIKVDGQSWTARPYSSDVVIEQGTEIEVYEIDGVIAVVYPKHGLLP
jgi:membrane protein implicated in regulation of membrane protease activity